MSSRLRKRSTKRGSAKSVHDILASSRSSGSSAPTDEVPATIRRDFRVLNAVPEDLLESPSSPPRNFSLDDLYTNDLLDDDDDDRIDLESLGSDDDLDNIDDLISGFDSLADPVRSASSLSPIPPLLTSCRAL